MKKNKAFIAVYDSLADWEAGHLLAELRSGRFTDRPFEVRSVAATPEPITTMGGLRIEPDLTIDAVDPDAAALLILPGADLWDEGGGREWAALGERFLAAGTPVAAICGATFGLARAGVLDERRHTSAAPEYLAASGYRGGGLYADARAIADEERLLITAGPDAPVQFAAATLEALGLIDPTVRAAYEGVFGSGDAAAYPTLMQHRASA